MCLLLYHDEVVFKGIMDLMEDHQRVTHSTEVEVQREADLLLCRLLLHGLSAKGCDLKVLCLTVALGKIWSDFHGVDDKNNCNRVFWIQHSGHGLEVNMVVAPGWWLDLMILEVIPNPNHSAILGLYVCKCKQALWKIERFSDVKRLFEVLLSHLWNGHLPIHNVELLYS